MTIRMSSSGASFGSFLSHFQMYPWPLYPRAEWNHHLRRSARCVHHGSNSRQIQEIHFCVPTKPSPLLGLYHSFCYRHYYSSSFRQTRTKCEQPNRRIQLQHGAHLGGKVLHTLNQYQTLPRLQLRRLIVLETQLWIYVAKNNDAYLRLIEAATAVARVRAFVFTFQSTLYSLTSASFRPFFKVNYRFVLP